MQLGRSVTSLGVLVVASWWVASGCSAGETDVFGGASTGAGASSPGAGASTADGPGPGGNASSTNGGNGTGTGGNSTAGNAGGAGAVVCGDFVCDPSECGVCAPDCGPTCVAGCGNG